MAQIGQLAVVMRPVAELVPYAANARLHSAAQVQAIAASIRAFGWTVPVLIGEDGGIVAGHGRVLAAVRLGLGSVPCVPLAHLSAAQRRAYVLADNRLAELSGWDDALRASELGALRGLGASLGFSLEEVGLGLGPLVGVGSRAGGSAGIAPALADRFLVPPFSVLDGGSDWWVARRAAWCAALGLAVVEGVAA